MTSGIDITLTERLAMVHDQNIDPVSRELWLVGETDKKELPPDEEPGIEYAMASRFAKNMRILHHIGDGPVFVHMKTCGGSEEEGFAIYDTLKLCHLPTTILSYTHARSMSSVVLQAADRRLLMPSSYVLLHWGSLEVAGDYQMVQSNVEFSRDREARYLNVFAKRMMYGKDWASVRSSSSRRRRILAWLREQMAQKVDVIMEPRAAIRLGLADAVFDGGWKQ